jgi:hypothetical protein
VCIRPHPSLQCPTLVIHWKPSGDVPVVGVCPNNYVTEQCRDNPEGDPNEYYC